MACRSSNWRRSSMSPSTSLAKPCSIVSALQSMRSVVPLALDCSWRRSSATVASTSCGVSCFGLSMLASRFHKFARRPRPAQPQANSFRSARAAQTSQKALTALARHQSKPAISLALLAPTPLAHCVCSDALQLAFHGRNAPRGFLAALQILATADRLGCIGRRLVGPVGNDLILHRAFHPRQRLAIELLFGGEVLLQVVTAVDQRRKTERHRRCRCEDIPKYLMELQRCLFHRLSSAQARLDVLQIAPVHAHAEHLARRHGRTADDEGDIDPRSRLGDTVKKTGHL